MSDPTELLGRWRLRRRVVDHRAGDEVRAVEGFTTLRSVDDDSIRWDEIGTMRWAWNEVPIARTLFLRRRADCWFVTFEDGRDFHPWRPGADVEHPCAADLYSGRVDVDSPDAWRVRWRAQGPDKDYEIDSWLTRELGDEPVAAALAGKPVPGRQTSTPQPKLNV